MESPTQFEGRSSIVFGNAPNFHTPLPSPTPSKVLKQAPKIPIESCHPEWVESLGVWLTNRRVGKTVKRFSYKIVLNLVFNPLNLGPCWQHKHKQQTPV